MKVSSVAVAALLLAAPAFAQSNPAPAPSSPPAATVAPQGEFYSNQTGDMRASKLIGTNVTNTANESVGEINDVVLGKDGKVAAVIVGVGGFLGIGEREVALSYGSLRFSRDSGGRDVIAVNATKDQLKAAPAWRWEPASK